VRIYGNWPAPAYLTAIILVAALYSPARHNGISQQAHFWKASVILAYLITLPLLVHLVYPILPLPPRLDRIAKETAGWDQLGTRIRQEVAAMTRPEQTFIFGLRYQYASELAFYTPGRPETVSINRWARPNVYDYWTDEHDLIGKDGIGVYEWKGMAERIARLFERIDPPETVTLYRDSPWFGRQAVQTLYIIRGYRFKGGLHWQPRDTSDIRATRQVTDGRKENQGTLRTRKTTP
jgi:undecaprenyl-diphosphatase